MVDKNLIARDIIEEDLKRKMLGPGYAADIFDYSDFNEEILPNDPRYLYSIGVIKPSTNSANAEPQETDASYFNAEDSESNDAEEDPETSYNFVNDSRDNKYDGSETDEGQNLPADSQNINVDLINRHIGLVTCVSPDTTTLKVSASYGTYRKLTWNQSRELVRVKSGKFTSGIKDLLERLSQDENFIQKYDIDTLKRLIYINEQNETISLAPNSIEPADRIYVSRNKYGVEADLLAILFGPHYIREHHAVEFELDLSNADGSQLFEDMEVKWNTYDFMGKKIVKILLRGAVNSSRFLYQPSISVEAKDGSITSYVDTDTSIEDDTENTINEFIYRDVKNYGKGVNCAMEWTESDSGVKVSTSFTPTIDIPKFSNEIADDSLKQVCVLRNLSIWSSWDKDEMLRQLRLFADGYASWNANQKRESTILEAKYTEAAETIIYRQKELVDRLYDNITYLSNNPEALECFKIANTAMLLQMVVARDKKFEKNLDAIDKESEGGVYNSLDFFQNKEYTICEPSYRPFQLAFLLMNVKSTFEIADPYHKDIVDLIWFPTGGGKTEAYLALTALTIVQRRRRGQEEGVSVLMRYTLRLLTTQQFERASYLICALEFLRNKLPELNLGGKKNPISIGIYVGSGVTPNRIKDLSEGKFKKFKDHDYSDPNPYPVTYCPWCGSKLVRKDDRISTGYNENGTLYCVNTSCGFNSGLPIDYIDENIYDHKPTLLFATVDKMAQLYKSKASALLCPNPNIDSPDLIIQDELHLLVGALGSIVGFFETIVEELIKKGGRIPKIIASTATTRNTESLIKKLFNRQVAVFPPQGLDYSDNYFSHIENGAKRRHIGLMPSSHVSSNVAEIRLTAFLLLARAKVFKKWLEDKGVDWSNWEAVASAFGSEGELPEELDNYWTTVLYYNSLKDLGRSRSRVGQEVNENFLSHMSLYSIPTNFRLLRKGFDKRVMEFTSRINSSEIKGFLTKAASPLKFDADKEALKVTEGCDLTFASNMISVGIDIARWNIMVMVGQPRSTSEYVQSSSRVARNTFGLVLNLLNPVRSREHSLFENYIPFHKTYYKSVEPLSITPLTPSTIHHKVINNIITIYKKVILDGGKGKKDIEIAQQAFENLFDPRFSPNGEIKDILVRKLTKSLKSLPTDNRDTDFWAKSLRDIAKDGWISIEQINYTNR